jgi:hypothetical protein
MSERFTVRLARLISAALGPNPLDAVCADMPEHDAQAARTTIIHLARHPRSPIRPLSVA